MKAITKSWAESASVWGLGSSILGLFITLMIGWLAVAPLPVQAQTPERLKYLGHYLSQSLIDEFQDVAIVGDNGRFLVMASVTGLSIVEREAVKSGIVESPFSEYFIKRLNEPSNLDGAPDEPKWAPKFYEVIGSGSYLYVASRWDGLWIFRLEDTGAISEVGRLMRPREFTESVKILNDKMFLTHHADGIEVLDLADPGSPQTLAILADGFVDAWGIAPEADGSVWVADGMGGLKLARWNGNQLIHVTGETLATSPGVVQDVAVAGDWVVGAIAGQGVAVYRKATAARVGTFPLQGVCVDLEPIDDKRMAVSCTDWVHVIELNASGQPSIVASTRLHRRKKHDPNYFPSHQAYRLAWDGEVLYVGGWHNADAYWLVKNDPDDDPDIRVSGQRAHFSADPAVSPEVISFRIANAGEGVLNVSEVICPAALVCNLDSALLQPDDAIELTLSYDGSRPDLRTQVDILSNDPDDGLVRITVFTPGSDRVDPQEPAPDFTGNLVTYDYVTQTFSETSVSLSDFTDAGQAVHLGFFGAFCPICAWKGTSIATDITARLPQGAVNFLIETPTSQAPSQHIMEKIHIPVSFLFSSAGDRLYRQPDNIGGSLGLPGLRDYVIDPAGTVTTVLGQEYSPQKILDALKDAVGGSPQEPIRVNIGGGTYTDVSGNLWSADSGCNTGNLSKVPGPIGGTLDEFLFLTHRWDSDTAPEMTCSYAVQPGDYQVTLYFAETNSNNFSVGARVFDVTMEGMPEFNNIDIFQEAGGNTALLKTTTVNVTDGQLDIQFLHQVKNPLVKAIQIIPTGGSNVPPVITTSPVTNATVGVPYSYDVDATDSPSDTLQYFLDVAPLSMTIGPNSGVISWTPVAGDEGPQSVTVRVQDQGGLEDTQSYTLMVVASGQLPIRVNIGGGTYTDVSGNLWSADSGCNTGNLSKVPGPIGGTLDEFLFLTHRWDSDTAPEMTCSYAVQPGDYQVTLYFAETNSNNFSVGARVFDVTMEGMPEFNNIDIFQEAGGNTALLKTTTVNVTDGQLDIQFLHQVKNPLVKAIQIIPTGGSSNVPPVITTSPVTNATVGVPYSYDVDATDSPSDTLQYFLDVAPLSMTIGPNSGVISWTPVAGDEGPQSVTVRVQDQGGLEDTQSYTLMVVASGQLPIRVNIGGGTYTDVSGNLWSADSGCNTGNLSKVPGPIGGTLDEFLFLTHRWDSDTAPEMTCSYAVQPGDYQVTLYFAETNSNNFSVGARVFDVTMEGMPEFNNIDIFQEAGGNTALLKTTTVNVTDGQLDIQFLHQVKNPLVKAIQIRE